MQRLLKLATLFLASQGVTSFTPGSAIPSGNTLQKNLRTNADLSNSRPMVAGSRSSSSTSLLMMEPNSIIESTSSFISTLEILSNDNIKQAFSVATFGPQYLWILMVLLPNTQITKKIMGGYGGIIAFSLVHLFIVVASASQENGTAPIAEFNGVFDPSPDADPQAAMIGMMKYPNFVSEEWSHVLTWDLFVGRWIWLDGLKRGIFTCHSVLLTNLIGPPGFLLHCATCLVTGKGIVGNEVPEDEEEEEQK
jgi:hypothetical protein